MESPGPLGIHGDDGEVEATRHRQHQMEATDRMRTVAVRRVVLRPLGHPGGRVTPLRGVFLIWGTPLFPSFTWGRGNNSNLACLSPEESTYAQHGFSFLESRFFHL